MVTEFVVTAGELPKRLDIFLVNREPKLSRSALQRLIGQGRVRINGQVVKPSQKIKPGDTIAFDIPKAEPLELKGESIPLEILYEDDVLLLLNKPAGLVVHPAPGHWAGTLVNALLHHFQTSGGTVSTIGGKGTARAGSSAGQGYLWRDGDRQDRRGPSCPFGSIQTSHDHAGV